MAIKRLYRTMMAGAGACALSLAALPAQAGQWWIFGDKIYNTGAVTASDDATLRAMLAKARADNLQREAGKDWVQRQLQGEP